SKMQSIKYIIMKTISFTMVTNKINKGESRKLKKVLFLCFALFISISLVACGEAEVKELDNIEEETTNSKDNEDQNENQKDQEVADDENKKYEVGDTVEFDGMEITLNEVRIEEGGQFDTPENDQFIVANLTVENMTDEEQLVSSIMNIELKDDEGYAYNTTFLTEGTKGQLDGSIESGGKLTGEIPFDVATSETYELNYSYLLKSGKAIWIISNIE